MTDVGEFSRLQPIPLAEQKAPPTGGAFLNQQASNHAIAVIVPNVGDTGVAVGTGAGTVGCAWLLRVNRWTKWYGGHGPESCMWHSRIVALVIANLFW
jgi:hypothetical protein